MAAKGDVKMALERVAEAGADFVYLQFTDILGAVKGVTIPTTRLERAFGSWVDALGQHDVPGAALVDRAVYEVLFRFFRFSPCFAPKCLDPLNLLFKHFPFLANQ